MFVSQEKQAQHQAARKLKLWSRVVAVVAVIGIGLVFCVVFYGAVFPSGDNQERGDRGARGVYGAGAGL